MSQQEKLTATEVAKAMRKGTPFVTEGIKNGTLPIGVIGKTTKDIYITPKRLYEFTGLKMGGYEPEPVYLITPELFDRLNEEQQNKIIENVNGIRRAV